MPKREVDVPEHLTKLWEAMTATLEEVKARIERLGGGKAVDYGAVEEAIAADARRVEGASHQAILQALDIDAPAVVIGGKRYVRVGRCEAPYHTLAGSVSVERSLYRESGTRGGTPEGRVVDAVSLRAGVVGEGWLPHTARAMAYAGQQGTSREAEMLAEEWGRVPYSRSSFERVTHLVGALTVAAHQDIEDVLIDAYEVPPEGRSLSVSLDRVSVPMEEPRPRPVGRPRKDAPKRPVARNFRMAYCGTVTLHDKDGAALHTIRYGCMPEGDLTGLRDRLVADVTTLVSKRPRLPIELLCDGAPEMWGLLEEKFTPEQFTGPITELVDLYHVMEKLAPAAAVLDGAGAATTLAGWKLALLNRQHAAATIRTELIGSGKEQVRVGKERPVHAALTYLASQHEEADRMNYARARRLGLPLGSGSVEATCKSLFEQRLKRCGARWKNATGEHIVELRALALSDRWGPAIDLTLRPLRKAVRPAA
jgi:hypothetical protein